MTATLRTPTPADMPPRTPQALDVDALVNTAAAGVRAAIRDLRTEVDEVATNATDSYPDARHTRRLNGASAALTRLLADVDQTLGSVRRTLRATHPDARPTP